MFHGPMEWEKKTVSVLLYSQTSLTLLISLPLLPLLWPGRPENCTSPTCLKKNKCLFTPPAGKRLVVALRNALHNPRVPEPGPQYTIPFLTTTLGNVASGTYSAGGGSDGSNARW